MKFLLGSLFVMDYQRCVPCIKGIVNTAYALLRAAIPGPALVASRCELLHLEATSGQSGCQLSLGHAPGSTCKAVAEVVGWVASVVAVLTISRGDSMLCQTATSVAASSE
jgi:hypothetical protein